MAPEEAGLPLCEDEPPAELLQGIAEFNRGEYFQAHETLEALWRREAGPIRLLYQGVIQVAVGLLHAQRGNGTGAVALLGRGIAKLNRFPPACLGMDVAALREEAGRYREACLAWRQGAAGQPPAETAPTIRTARHTS